ncbi:hypothetical protein SAMN02745157_3574 [Kaistia soli DSM 19436]|uniref:Uncharacterized protein n=1 Tax=Kaistia soli DSM 19436 TaxID=1122133 RepID=A0A1M5GZR7_9HYPH|nr:hypothetical protein SAMN02745157_3574 [Kaistia soli DSM 19436]
MTEKGRCSAHFLHLVCTLPQDSKYSVESRLLHAKSPVSTPTNAPPRAEHTPAPRFQYDHKIGGNSERAVHVGAAPLTLRKLCRVPPKRQGIVVPEAWAATYRIASLGSSKARCILGIISGDIRRSRDRTRACRECRHRAVCGRAVKNSVIVASRVGSMSTVSAKCGPIATRPSADRRDGSFRARQRGAWPIRSRPEASCRRR